MDRSKSILVADDDPAICQLLTALLKAPERRIVSVHNGREALQRIQDQHFDLLLTDVHMPGLDGLELLRQARQVRPDTKVVVMTADHTPANIVASIREHAFSFFNKPFEPAAVSELIAIALHAPEWRDDIEVLSARPEWISLRVRCIPSTADRLLQFFRALRMDLDASERENIGAAFREILMNAIEHGGHNDPRQRIIVACVRTTRAVIYYVRDPGEGFSMDALPHAAISNTPESPIGHVDYRAEHGLRPGGFGILLVRNLMDEVIYNEKGNEVVMIKYTAGREPLPAAASR